MDSTESLPTGASMKRVAAFFILLFLLLANGLYAQSHHSGSHSSKPHSSKSSTSKSKTSKSTGTVHVNGYYRKDGTYVNGYDRSTPGTGSSSSSAATPHTGTSVVPYKRNYIHPSVTADATVQRDKHGKIKRSSAAKGEFERSHPCPATGKTSGKCPGYVVDHVNPLECGGADAPSNMQWQTKAEAMECHRKSLADDKLPHRPMEEVEMADALIRILDYCAGHGLDLGGAYAEKMAYQRHPSRSHC